MSEENSKVFCCICGSEVLKSEKNLTGYRGLFEKWACSSHTAEERKNYVQMKAPGYCNICRCKAEVGQEQPKCIH